MPILVRFPSSSAELRTVIPRPANDRFSLGFNCQVGRPVVMSSYVHVTGKYGVKWSVVTLDFVTLIGIPSYSGSHPQDRVICLAPSSSQVHFL